MPDRVLKPEIETNDSFPSLHPEDFLQAWGRANSYLPVGTEVSLVSAESRVVVYSDPTSAGADRFRMAQMRLKSLQSTRKLNSVVITSPLPGDGKTTVALNLATVLSENGKVPVLLLEADVFRPTLVKRLGLEPWSGLSDCCKRGDDPIMAIRRIDPLGFYLLPAGQAMEDGTSLLQSNHTSHLIKGVSSGFFNWVLVDSPPTTPVSAVLALNAHVDGTLLVARAGKTPREAIEESIRNLGHDHILGIILNGVEGLEHMYSRYYGYGKSGAPSKSAKPKTIMGLGVNQHTK
jgi:protein-tyrosine kinase